MTIKKRLFISNTLMLIIPALVSILIILISMFLFMNLFYKQFMDETVKENNLSYIHELLVEQSKEFLDSNEDITDSKLYHTIEKYLSSQEMKLDIYDDTGIVCTIGKKYHCDSFHDDYRCGNCHKPFSYKVCFQKNRSSVGYSHRRCPSDS